MQETTPISTLKQQLRQEMIAKRGAIPSSQRLEASQAIALHYADHPYLTYAASFAGYYAFRGELDVLPIFNHMSRFNKQSALPRINPESNLLEFKLWQPGQPLVDHKLGMKEPDASADTITPEIILVPLLAFDSNGNRLGYGGGYYDRTIQALRQTNQELKCVGVAFTQQEYSEIPIDENDQKLDGVLTEEGASFF